VSDETTRKSGSAAKKIGRDAKKVPENRAKPDRAKREFSTQYQQISRWLGRQDSNLGLPRRFMYLKCQENWPGFSENTGAETFRVFVDRFTGSNGLGNHQGSDRQPDFAPFLQRADPDTLLVLVSANGQAGAFARQFVKRCLDRAASS
jgi:hypothetical protein